MELFPLVFLQVVTLAMLVHIAYHGIKAVVTYWRTVSTTAHSHSTSLSCLTENKHVRDLLVDLGLLAALALAYAACHSLRADLTALGMLVFTHAAYHGIRAVAVYWRIGYIMLIAIATSPIVNFVATFTVWVFMLLARSLSMLGRSVVALVLGAQVAISIVLVYGLLALLLALALLVKMLWMCVFQVIYVMRYVRSSCAVRYMIATVATVTQKMLTSMGSIAISIPIQNAQDQVTAWRVVSLCAGIQFMVTDIASHRQHLASIEADLFTVPAMNATSNVLTVKIEPTEPLPATTPSHVTHQGQSRSL